ncbi:hypothetical protein [Amycolatopsis thermophila]|uniref:Uncharacterized protein n=1 Tax=Amycolatopsis thermophila TaxID=206084 RepID=A0ABU0F7K6_9PSEU|nr:hypothetical protein [Amycolatopsis thermophila]MDQ0383002.1 hypothetical protein [Amycolatopsis thermophila]
MKASTPIGRLIQNMLRHPALSTSTPPSSGPSASATPLLPRSGEQFGRGGQGNRHHRGREHALRAPISAPLLGAAAQATDASVNPAIPASSVRRRPRRSPSDPAVSRRQAKAGV